MNGTQLKKTNTECFSFSLRTYKNKFRYKERTNLTSVCVVEISLSLGACNAGDFAYFDDFIVNRVEHYFLCLLNEGFEALHRPTDKQDSKNCVKQNESLGHGESFDW